MRSRFATIALIARILVMILTVVIMNAGAAAVAVAAPAATHNRGIPEGVACLFLAPNGGEGFGHVGWAFSSPPHWIFGATEGVPGRFEIKAGEENNSWRAWGTWADVVNTFASGSNYDKGEGYYQSYTCKVVENAQPDVAFRQAVTGAETYTFPENNCLTKAVDIVRAYGLDEIRAVKGLYFRAPNNYFDFLPKGYPQWSEVHPVTHVE